MKLLRLILFQCIVLTLLSANAFAYTQDSLDLLGLTPVLPPTINTDDGTYYKSLNVRHGLNSNQVKCILEDHEGNIWLGSYGGGLFKYDGHKLTHFQKKSGIDRFIRALHQDADHNIWIGTQKGVYKYDGRILTHYTEEDGLKSTFIMNIMEDENNDIWISSWPDQVQKFNKTTQEFDASSLVTRGSYNFLVDRKKRFWICTEQGLMLKNSNDKFEQVDLNIEGESNLHFRGICEDYNGWIWAVADTNRVFKINPDNLEFERYDIPENELPKGDRFVWIKSDKRGNLYLGMWQNGLFVINAKNNSHKFIFKKFEFGDALVDDYHTIWLADRSHGLVWMPETPFENFDIGTKRGAYGLIKSNDSLIYGSFREGLRFLKKGKVHNYEQDYFTQSRYYFSCFINDNHFYIGTRDGLLQFKNGITTFHRGVNRIRTISRLGDSLLIGTEYGLEMFDLKSEKLIDTKDFIEEDFNFYVNDISVVGRNDWWLATDKHGILRMVEGKVVDQLTTANGLCHNHTLSMCFDANRNLWVGTHDGLSVYKNGKFLSFSTDDGLSHSLIHTLALDSAGFLWAGTERGLNRISLEQDKLVTKIYGINEGFLGNDCAENSVFIEPDNTIWWGTGTKISKYNPLLDQEDLIPPSVRIDEVLVHFRDVHHYEKIGQTKGFQYSRISKWNNLPENLELQHFMNHITIKFISIDWKTPDKLLYQFKLEGFEDEWSPAATKKSVTYSNLAAGKYTFLVKARNDDGYWSEPKSFSFVVHPPWWKTIFARIIFSVIVLLMLISYINLRTKNLKAKQKELEKIVRERTTEIKFQKDEIEKQKELVDLKNKEITDSVKYASRIQRALLEPEDHVNKLMPEHFIFFQPRNIVSGDFYWSNIQDNSVFICAADCTGHGVPGAMLSMLGISFLNQISHNNSQIGPDDILNKLRKHMIRELSQKGLDEDSKDGIDAGLIKLQNGTAHYAGANNAAYVIRDKSFPAIPGDRKIVENETKVLYEIRGDKQPIGYHPNKNWDFNSSSFETHKGDLIYLFSDGFPDQFGGKKGKKLKYAPFKQYLLSICHLDINAQKLEIQSKFQEWKGEYEQVDDVLVIGIRI